LTSAVRWRLCELQIEARRALSAAYERRSPRPIAVKLARADRLLAEALDRSDRVAEAGAIAAAERALASWLAHCRASSVRWRLVAVLTPPAAQPARGRRARMGSI